MKIDMKITHWAALFLIALGCVILLVFLAKSHTDGFSISFDSPTNYAVSGQFGDFFGGVAGTFFALSGTLLIYLNFNAQRKQNELTSFESSFFEMLRLHRDNISELKYTKHKHQKDYTYENRQVFREISKEFIQCYREVKKISNSKKVEDYVLPTHQVKFNSIANKAGIKIDAIELAIIDLAYMVVFFGLGEEGEQLIKQAARAKYNPKYYFRLLHYIKLKPKGSHPNWSKWGALKNLQEKDLHETLDILYSSRKDLTKLNTENATAKLFLGVGKYEKYYGGHQLRLGHYFRHLYQSYKFLDSSDFLNDAQKRHYGKMLRAQLSTYEQALLFINSLSWQGMRWGIRAEIIRPQKSGNENNTKSDYIARYELIKNLPGAHMSGIRYRRYYPSIIFETDEIGLDDNI